MTNDRSNQGSRAAASRAAATLLSMILVGAGCSSGADRTRTEPANISATELVGVRTETFVNSEFGAADRVLETTIYYPARGAAADDPVQDAPPDRRNGPYPVIVFAHGLGARPAAYSELFEEWARAGFVVAAPRFPGTSSDATDGIDPGDYVHQPADVSAVITGVEQVGSGRGPLAGVPDPGAVGVAGHSLGGITTLGVAAHSCCRDERIAAAVVLAGDPLAFPEGEFDYPNGPPILLVHGTEDALVPFDASVDVFNAASAPKVLVRINDGDHLAPTDASGTGFPAVVATTVDFFDAYLRGDPAALGRLESDGTSRATTVVVATEPGSRTTIPTEPRVLRALEATVTPDEGLVNGQTVTVSWRGFTPGKTINIVQCSNRIAGDAAACDLRHGKILQPNPTGNGSLPLEMVVGPVGSGVCDAAHDRCQVVVNDGGSLDPAASVRVDISFASG